MIYFLIIDIQSITLNKEKILCIHKYQYKYNFFSKLERIGDKYLDIIEDILIECLTDKYD